MAFVEWVITVSAPSFLVDSIFHILTNCLLFPLFSGTSSQLTGLYCLSPEAMPMVHSWDDPSLIDSVISKRQRPQLQGPGWYLCFNEAKVTSVFVCEAALSQLELKVSSALREDHKPTSPLCWVLKTCQVLLCDSFRGTSLPTSFCEKVASRSRLSSPWPLSRTHHTEQQTSNTPLSVESMCVSYFSYCASVNQIMDTAGNPKFLSL